MKIVVDAVDENGCKSNPTAIELAAALTYAHRLMNNAYALGFESNELGDRAKSSLNAESALVNIKISEVANGSVLLNGVVEIINNVTPHEIAVSVVANIISNALLKVAKKTTSALRRIARPSRGRELNIFIKINNIELLVNCCYEDFDRARIIVTQSKSDEL